MTDWPEYRPERLIREPEILQGNGGPGTIYSAFGYVQAVAKHGRPFGPFEHGRICKYNTASWVREQ